MLEWGCNHSYSPRLRCHNISHAWTWCIWWKQIIGFNNEPLPTFWKILSISFSKFLCWMYFQIMFHTWISFFLYQVKETETSQESHPFIIISDLILLKTVSYQICSSQLFSVFSLVTQCILKLLQANNRLLTWTAFTRFVFSCLRLKLWISGLAFVVTMIH